MEPKLFIATKAFIICERKMLIIREGGSYQDGTQIGRWDVPGGRLKAGEHFDEALRREVKEETGLDIEIEKIVSVNESWPVVRGEQWQIVRMFFACRASSDLVRVSEDHDAYQWIDPRTYRDHGLVENLYEPIEAFLQNDSSYV